MNNLKDIEFLIHLRDCYQKMIDDIHNKTYPGYAAYDVIDLSAAYKNLRDLNDIIYFMQNNYSN